MAAWEGQLAQIIEKEISLLNEIYECSREKTSMLAKGDVEGISKIVDREQTLSLLMQTAEKKRLALLRENRAAGKTLRQICSEADGEYKDVLESQLETLTKAVEQLKKSNDLNNELTKSRLEFYGKLRSLYSQSAYGYTKEIEKNSPEGSGIIDRSV